MESEKTNQGLPRDFPEWLRNFPGILAIVSLATLMLTVVHEWGYFGVIGSHFQTLISPSDYLANSILWLPQNVVIFISVLIVSRIMAATPRPKVYLSERVGARKYGILVLGLLFVCLTALATLTTSWAMGVFTALVLSGVFYAMVQLIHNPALRVRWYYNSPWPYFACLGVGFAFVFGDIEATLDVQRYGAVYEVKLKESQAGKRVVLMRSLEKGILVHDIVGSRIEFIKWEGIESISVGDYGLDKPENPACQVFGIGCRFEVSPGRS